jgi:hypothetical protein
MGIPNTKLLQDTGGKDTALHSPHACFENVTDMQPVAVAHDTASLESHRPLFLWFLLGILSFQHCASSLFDITHPTF